MADKPQKNGKESCYKTLVKQRKHLSLALESFKNWENIERKRKAGNILRKREVQAKTRWVGISVIRAFYF